jgi:hypothetical protein
MRSKKATFFVISLAGILSSCAQRGETTASNRIPDQVIPWQRVQNELATFRARHAHRSEFERLAEGSRRLHTVSELETIAFRYGYSAAERSEHRRWFREAASVIYFGFEANFSGVVFFDSTDHAAYTLLFG